MTGPLLRSLGSGSRHGSDDALRLTTGRCMAMSPTMTQNGSPRALQFVVRQLGHAVMAAVLAAIAGAIVVLMVLPRATQGAALTVLTGSMTPRIPVGSVVLVRPVDPATLEVGDVATYQSDPGTESFVTHRIVAIDTATTPISFTFKGDANPGEDIRPVPATAIRGEVWFHVPYLGAVRDALNGRAGLSLLAIIVLAGYAIGQAAGAVRDRRRRHAPGTEGDRAPDDIGCDRPLVVAELGITEDDPDELARCLNGVVLNRSGETVKLLIAPSASALDAVLLNLQVYAPVAVHVVDEPKARLVLRPRRAEEATTDPRTARRVPV